MLILVAVLAALYFVSPQFETRHDEFEKFVGKLIHQPIKIERITLGSRGLEPVLKLHNVIIFNDAKTKKILGARELQVGIDLLGSLFRWQIKPGVVLIRGSDIVVHQNKNGKISIVGVSDIAAPFSSANTEQKISFEEIAPWLFEQSRIDLKDITFKWQKAGSETIKITNLYLKLHNGILEHNLKINGEYWQQNSAARFHGDLKLRGDFLKRNLPSVAGELVLDEWKINLEKLKFSDIKNYGSGGGFVLPVSGDVNLVIKKSTIISRVLREHLVAHALRGRVIWDNDDKRGLKINIEQLEFWDNYLNFSGSGQFLFLPKTQTPIVDMQLEFELVNLAKAKLYYPVAILPSDATAWLDQAFIYSKPFSGRMVLQGPLDKFPFDHNEGRFFVDSNILDVHLNYDSAWPHIENINGKINFANRAMTIIADSASILNAPLRFAKVVIPDLDTPVLQASGAIDADSSVGMKFINSSPLQKTMGHKLQTTSLSGPMRLDLKLIVPLANNLPNNDVKITGDIELYNNRLHAQDLGFSVHNLNGNLHFDDANLVAPKLTGKIFNRPVKLTLHTERPESQDPVTQIGIVGSATVKDFEHAFAVKLSPQVVGEFNYEALLELHGMATKRNVFKLNSNLQGIKVVLPEPFNKGAESDYKFDLQCYFGGQQTPEVKVNYNNQITAVLRVKKTSANVLQLLGGEVRFGSGISQPPLSSGLALTGNIAKLDWTVWKKYLVSNEFNYSSGSSIIKKISLNIGELHLLGEIFRKVLLKMQPQNGGWDIEFLTTNIDGKIFFPSKDKETMRGVFKKFYLRREQQNLASLNPKELSPLNVKFDNFQYGDKKIDHLEFITEPSAHGVKINKLVIREKEFNINAAGSWLMVDNKQSSELRGTIASNDVGELLKQWEVTDNMIGGRGTANFALKWPDSPYNPTLATVNGNFSINVSDGRIVNLSKHAEAKIGFGRVLSMLSLQSLPRRLSLDFSDLTREGFGFNSMIGNFELINGIALIKKLNLDGHVAQIKAYGKIGLKAQNYDMMLSAVPNITSSIPVAATILGGPIVGALSFVADKVVSSVMKEVTSYTYHITGSWTSPKIDKN